MEQVAGAGERRYLALIRQGMSSQAASLMVGVSPSCGSLWFIDAGRGQFVETPISSRYLTQDDRIEICRRAGARRAGEADRRSDQQVVSSPGHGGSSCSLRLVLTPGQPHQKDVEDGQRGQAP